MNTGQRARIEAAAERAGFKTQQALADATEVAQATINALLTGKRPLTNLLRKIAELTGVSYNWLRFGDAAEAPEWARATELLRRVSETAVPYEAPMQLVGTVRAGEGAIAEYTEESRPFPVPNSWSVIKVEGMSAYPVVYPDQFVIIDLQRAKRPAEMETEDYIDLDDNIVLIQLDQRRSYLKRFCYQPAAPGRIVFASVDGGRRSPWIDEREILLVVPVVGVLYQDPTKPRKKRYHPKTVIPPVDNGQ